MTDYKKINYFDLRREYHHGKLPKNVGRADTIERIARILHRSSQNNVLLVGERGIGKTTALFGVAQFIIETDSNQNVILLYPPDLQPLNNQAVSSRYEEAVLSLPKGTYVIDNFGDLCINKILFLQQFSRIFRPLIVSPKANLIVSVTPHEFEWLKNADENFVNQFERIILKEQPEQEIITVLDHKNAVISQNKKVFIPDEVRETIFNLCKKFPQLGALPYSAISLLDESASLAMVKKNSEVTSEDVYAVVQDKTGIPASQLSSSEYDMLRTLEPRLNQEVIGQEGAIRAISTIIKRGKLGLKNPNRPLGSFLLLGPSGVGKTETAKTLARLVFGTSERFIRIDMSEFGEPHTVQRLIGAPPGYLGFESGGEITNMVKENPYSLLLLDEIEKAHPKIFDIFLQVLDDGRLTSGQGETISFTNSVIMATSNVGIQQIVDAHQAGVDVASNAFVKETLYPLLTQSFRTEFLNRFDAIIAFSPLNESSLLNIAKYEIKKIESRMAHHHIRFAIQPEVLMTKVKEYADPRLGARPVKRFVEEICETLIANQLLKERL